MLSAKEVLERSAALHVQIRLALKCRGDALCVLSVGQVLCAYLVHRRCACLSVDNLRCWPSLNLSTASHAGLVAVSGVCGCRLKSPKNDNSTADR